jgi:hypothetical protein
MFKTKLYGYSLSRRSNDIIYGQVLKLYFKDKV